MRDARTLERIRRLAIPPAWTDVRICPSANGHIQAVGRDARRRKQYRYHPRWREVRDATKFHRVLAFAVALDRIRAAVVRDLRRRGLPRDKVLATVVRLLETTHVRVGNDEYARENHSYGLTTLQDRHVTARGSVLTFRFRGKSGKANVVDVHDPRLARIVRACSELEGHELFQYAGDDGALHRIGSGDVNGYIRRVAGNDFTAKDFRTWAGTLLAARALRACEAASTDGRRSAAAVRRCIARVAEALHNTPAVCRRAYVHPAVLQAYIDGSLACGRAEDDKALVLRVLRSAACSDARARSTARRSGRAPSALSHTSAIAGGTSRAPRSPRAVTPLPG